MPILVRRGPPTSLDSERGKENNRGREEKPDIHPTAVPDPEGPDKAVRRKFSAAYKLRILNEAERRTEPGQLGSLLCLEGT